MIKQPGGLTRRDLGRLGAALTTGSLLGSGAAAGQPAARTALDPFALIDHELRPIARQIQAAMATQSCYCASNLPQLRALALRRAVPARLADIPVVSRTIRGSRGAPAIKLFVVNFLPGASRPGILYMHGGGFVLGAAETDVPMLQRLARALDCVIVAVNYRLAPETRFAGSIEDNYTGLAWMHTHAQELGVDSRRVALLGQSAGGGHAALLAILARDRGEFPILFQALIYPMLDDRTGSIRAAAPTVGKILWTAEANRFGWEAFLGQMPGTAHVPAKAVPARVVDLTGLPPAFVSVGSLDLFVNEDLEYAQRLIAAGIPTELLVVPGAFHGFDVIAPNLAISRRFTAAKIGALRRAFSSAANG